MLLELGALMLGGALIGGCLYGITSGVKERRNADLWFTWMQEEAEAAQRFRKECEWLGEEYQKLALQHGAPTWPQTGGPGGIAFRAQANHPIQTPPSGVVISRDEFAEKMGLAGMRHIVGLDDGAVWGGPEDGERVVLHFVADDQGDTVVSMGLAFTPGEASQLVDGVMDIMVKLRSNGEV